MFPFCEIVKPKFLTKMNRNEEVKIVPQKDMAIFHDVVVELKAFQNKLIIEPLVINILKDL